MSDKEEFYDKEVAPVLLELANKCAERGLHFLAQVEYDPGKFGLTRKFSGDPDIAMIMLDFCARSRRNIDGYIMGLMRYCTENKIDFRQSMVMRILSGEPRHSTGDDND